MMENALILFLKYPQRGAVKTRLARVLGDDLTLDLYRSFLLDIAAMMREVKTEKILVYSGPKDVTFAQFPKMTQISQRGDDIGSRMYNALEDVFSLGFKKGVLIGSDTPDLTAGAVNCAFDKLKDVDIVLGPTTDGGYYLVACKCDSLRRSIFENIPWSTADVLSLTIQRVAESGLEYTLLEPWSDVDEVDDLKKFYKRNNDKVTKSHVMSFLKTKGIIHEL